MQTNFDETTGRKQFFDNVNKELNKLIDPATGKVKAELLEYVNCPICDTNSYDHLFVKQGFDFVRWLGELTARLARIEASLGGLAERIDAGQAPGAMPGGEDAAGLTGV